MAKKADLKGLLEYVVKSLVEEPEQVSINSSEKEKGLVFELKVSQKDRGRIIGKQGKTIKALRRVLSAAGSGSGKKIFLELVE